MNPIDGAFAEKYGPWAMIAGASEGVGAEFARAMSERGINVLLLARRREPLETLAATIRAETGADARAVPVDLSDDDAFGQILDATDGLDIGMMMYCAGADPNYEPFLENDVQVALSMVQRNCVIPMQMCHYFAQPMVDRGRGGIILLSSGAGFRGGTNMVAYGATKAFDMVMGEALWAELHERGVDVLSLVLGATDTPGLRRTLAKRGMLTNPDDPVEIPGLSTPHEVVADALEHLADGPTWIVGEHNRESYQRSASITRSEAVRAMVEAQRTSVMSTDHRQTVNR